MTRSYSACGWQTDSKAGASFEGIRTGSFVSVCARIVAAHRTTWFQTSPIDIPIAILDIDGGINRQGEQMVQALSVSTVSAMLQLRVQAVQPAFLHK